MAPGARALADPLVLVLLAAMALVAAGDHIDAVITLVVLVNTTLGVQGLTADRAVRALDELVAPVDRQSARPPVSCPLPRWCQATSSCWAG